MTKQKSSEAEFPKLTDLLPGIFQNPLIHYQGLSSLISYLNIDFPQQTISNVLLLHFAISGFKFRQPRSKPTWSILNEFFFIFACDGSSVRIPYIGDENYHGTYDEQLKFILRSWLAWLYFSLLL